MIFFRSKARDIVIFVVVFAAVGAIFLLKTSHPFVGSDYSVVENSSVPKVQVATSLTLAADWINSVGGQRVQTTVINSLSDPVLDNWAKQSSGNVNLQNSGKLFFAAGGGFDDWAQQISQKFPDVTVIDLSSFVLSTSTAYKPLTYISEVTSTQSYYWLSFENLRDIVQGIARTLGSVDVASKEYYINNAYEYSVALDSLLKESLSMLSGFYRRVVLDGTRLEPLAASLKLNTFGTINIQNANSQAAISDIRNALKRNRIKAIITDNTSSDNETAITNKTAVLVAHVDPWDNQGESYSDFMRDTVSQILRVLESV